MIGVMVGDESIAFSYNHGTVHDASGACDLKQAKSNSQSTCPGDLEKDSRAVGTYLQALHSFVASSKVGSNNIVCSGVSAL